MEIKTQKMKTKIKQIHLDQQIISLFQHLEMKRKMKRMNNKMKQINQIHLTFQHHKKIMKRKMKRMKQNNQMNSVLVKLI